MISTLKDKVNKIENHLDTMIKITEEQQTDTSKLDNILQILNENLTEINDLADINNDLLRKYFEAIAAWILKNFSSVKLNSVITLISVILNKIGFKVEIKREGII
jgi:hypothetical protein